MGAFSIKKMISAVCPLVLVAGCIGGIYLSQKGVNVGDKVKDIQVEDVVDAVKSGGELKISKQEERKQLIMGDEPFEVTYSREPLIEYDRNNKKGIPAANYGETNEKSEYFRYWSEEYQKRVAEGGPDWCTYGIQPLPTRFAKERVVGLGETFKDPTVKVMFTVNSVKVQDNVKGLDYNKFAVQDNNKNFDKVIDRQTGEFTGEVLNKRKEKVDLTFLVVNMTVKSYCQWISDVCIDPQLTYVDDCGEYYEEKEKYSGNFTPDIGSDGEHNYFSKCLYEAGTKYYDLRLYYPMEYGEEQTFDLGWLVDRNEIDEHMMLVFGNDHTYFSDDLRLLNVGEILMEQGDV